MMKPLYLITFLSYFTILCLPLFHSVATAQKVLGCVINNASGLITDSSDTCERGRNEMQNLRMEMDERQLYQRGIQRFQGGLFQEAIADFTQVISTNPNLAEAYVFRSFCRRRTGDPQAAIQDFQKAADIYRARGNRERADIMLLQLQDLKQKLRIN